MNDLLINTINTQVVKRFGRNNPHIPNTTYKDILKVGKKTFGKYLRNEAQPRLDELERIANWLGVNPKELY